MDGGSIIYSQKLMGFMRQWSTGTNKRLDFLLTGDRLRISRLGEKTFVIMLIITTEISQELRVAPCLADNLCLEFIMPRSFPSLPCLAMIRRVKDS